jgi:hypothetical protein
MTTGKRMPEVKYITSLINWGAGAGGQGRVLRLHLDQPGVQVAVVHELGEVLHGVGLGSDRIGGDHLDPGLSRRLSHRHVAVPELGGHSVSLSSRIAPTAHSSAQMPHPLQ